MKDAGIDGGRKADCSVGRDGAAETGDGGDINLQLHIIEDDIIAPDGPLPPDTPQMEGVPALHNVHEPRRAELARREDESLDRRERERARAR